MAKKKVVIVGGGPAGLAAAYELLKQSSGAFDVTILEESNCVGGISRTVHFKGNKMDIGGHRFHNRIPIVEKWWEEILPVQGALAFDDKELKRGGYIEKGGPDPEKTDDVLLRRNRLCRIFFKGRFFDYPISLSFDAIKNMGFGTAILAGCSFLKSRVHKKPVESLEDYYKNQFGGKLYSMFFENYTENLWGIHPKDISPEYGMQRVNDEISIKKMLAQLFLRKKHENEQKVDTFSYPKLGPGQMWETVADKVKRLGGYFVMGAKVVGVEKDSDRIVSVSYKKGKNIKKIRCDYLVSSMPIKDLVAGMNHVPKRIRKLTEGLQYRDYIMVGVLCSKMALKNKTSIRTIGNIIPDQWVYVHDKGVKMGRFQVFNNWSPYLVKDVKHNVWMGLEYFCNEGDDMWMMPDKDFVKMAVNEMVKIGVIEDKQDVIDSCVVKIKKAYPAYFGAYDDMDAIKEYLNKVRNLFCVGRNGRHCYSDLDYSICSSFEAVKNIINEEDSKENVWNPQSMPEYKEDI